MTNGGFTVDPDGLTHFSRRMGDLAKLLPTVVATPDPKMQIGQTQAPKFLDGKELAAHYGARATAAQTNVTSFASALSQLASAAASLAAAYRRAADADAVSADQVDQLLGPQVTG